MTANLYQLLIVAVFFARPLELEIHARAFRAEFSGLLLEHKP